MAGRPLPVPRAARAARHLLDLLAVALGPTTEAYHRAAGRGVRAARLLAVRRYIQDHFTNPELTVARAARSLALSPRYIRSLLAGEHTTFSDEVAALRLERVHRDLRQPCHATTPIADLAFAAGWGEPSTFYRRLRARYGATPGEIRMQEATSATPQR